MQGSHGQLALGVGLGSFAVQLLCLAIVLEQAVVLSQRIGHITLTCRCPRTFCQLAAHRRIRADAVGQFASKLVARLSPATAQRRSEEHTSELQSRPHLVCRLLLDPPPTLIYTLSLHDALPISLPCHSP